MSLSCSEPTIHELPGERNAGKERGGRREVELGRCLGGAVLPAADEERS
jgi:hypothetical protein